MENIPRINRKLLRRIENEKNAEIARFWKKKADFFEEIKLHSTPINADAKKETFRGKK